LYFLSRKAEYDEQYARFNQAKAAALRDGRPFNFRPPPEMAFPEGRKWPGGLWNAMIHPLSGYTLRGVIWYQGEANAGRAYAYRTLFPLMIRTWRDQWGQGNFPFYWVQLANYQLPLEEPAATPWAELREAQTETLSVTNTAQAVAIDLADPDNPRDIHPRNKQVVGRRLALLARKNIYGETDLVAQGPEYKSHEIIGDKIIIHFDVHDEAGLTVRGDQPTGFAIAGADRKWVWAEAQLNPDGTVSVWSKQVPSPIAVRYGFETNPPINLHTDSDLPATPFRTDDWGWITRSDP
jgi:sialate O-acetylesterase